MDTIEIKGKQYNLLFASLFRVKKVGRLLDFDPLSQKLSDIDWSKILADDSRCLAVLSSIIADPVEEDIFDKLTVMDMIMLATSFFLRGQQMNVKFSDGLGSLNDIARVVNDKINPPKDMSSTTRSIPLEGEIRN